MDRNTARELTRSEEIKALVQSTGWLEVRKLLLDKMIELNDITNIEVTDPSQLVIIVRAKQEAVAILAEWLQQIEGIAKNADAIKQQMREQIQADFLIQFNDSEQGL